MAWATVYKKRENCGLFEIENMPVTYNGKKKLFCHDKHSVSLDWAGKQFGATLKLIGFVYTVRMALG